MLAAALTILLSSSLLFLVEPVLAKQILPWFGGSAGVWTICLLFFQLVLLLGYAYAHWLTRHPGQSRILLVHISLLLLSCLALPIIPATFWKPNHELAAPALQILGLLATTVGLPYFLLASTAPLLQHWLSGAAPGTAQDRAIYRLFALSNLGSIVGLLSYPFAIEPFTSVRAQAWIWSGAYAVFVICLVSYAFRRWRLRALPDARTTQGTLSAAPPSSRLYVYWIACATLGSTLLLAVTNHITQNIAPIPLLWVVPLTMYLLSFVICFEGRAARGWYERRFWMTPAMLATGAMAWALCADASNLSLYFALPIFVIGLFLGCVVCHGELARSKPNPDHLTHFYLSLATGGALGGLLVGIAAPQVFDSYWEMPLALIGLAALGIYVCSEEIRARPRTSWAANLVIASVATLLILLLLGGLPSVLDPYTRGWAKILQGDARWGCAALLVMTAVLLQGYRFTRSIAIAAFLCTLVLDWNYYHNMSTGVKFVVRNFYGTLRVTDTPYGMGHIRRLMHGAVLHGSQIMEPPERERPTTYYGESSGIGRTILSKRTAGPLRIGSIGLGAGTLAAYGRPGDVFRAYELNPAVLGIARNQFTYLIESGARIEPILGDARLSLEHEIAAGAFDKPAERFDVLSVDAFSGDGIPVHLLTREAFSTYARAVKPNGVIALHLSNRYLDLAPVVGQIARDGGFDAALIVDQPRGSELMKRSDWVLVTRSTAFLQQPDIKPYVTPIADRHGLPIWTDQFSNLFQILR